MTRTADQPRMATSRRVRRTLAAFVVAALLTAGCTLPAFAPRTEVEGAAAPTGSATDLAALPGGGRRAGRAGRPEHALRVRPDRGAP